MRKITISIYGLIIIILFGCKNEDPSDINFSINNGGVITYHSNGKIASKGTLQNGELNGEVVFYDIEGEKIKIINYKNGLKDGEEIHFENGSINTKILYSSNQKMMKSVFDSNKLYMQESYIVGTDRINSYIKYNPDGSIREGDLRTIYCKLRMTNNSLYIELPKRLRNYNKVELLIKEQVDSTLNYTQKITFKENEPIKLYLADSYYHNDTLNIQLLVTIQVGGKIRNIEGSYIQLYRDKGVEPYNMNPIWGWRGNVLN